VNQLLLAAESSTEGDGVNLLPIAVVLILLAVGVYLWRRSRG
jgi:hypothetical protein